MAMATHDVTDANVMGDINVTPMVDVMLVLLIIFMVVTPAIAAGFTAQLPMGLHLKAHEVKAEATTMGISSDGAYYLNKKPVPGCSAAARASDEGKISCDTRMLAMMQEDFAKHPQDHVLYLRADQSLPFQAVLDAMVLAKKSGVAMVAQVTEQQAGARPEDLEKADEE
jgi:biopolymer transport protein ExbD